MGCNVAQTIIDHPFGNGVYHLFLVIWRMIYNCYTHILEKNPPFPRSVGRGYSSAISACEKNGQWQQALQILQQNSGLELQLVAGSVGLCPQGCDILTSDLQQKWESLEVPSGNLLHVKE